MDGYLDSNQLADRLGIKRTSVHRYRVRGDIPQPDEYVGRTPMWTVETIERWEANRPGRGVGGGRKPKRQILTDGAAATGTT